jgi:hypothetical protein
MRGQATYLWVIEWDDSFVKPQRVEVRQVTRVPGVTDEAIERHLINVELPAQAAAATRVGGVMRQLLIKLTGEHEDATGYATEPEGVAKSLGTVGVAVGSNGVVVWNSDSSGQVSNGEA